MRHYDWSKAGLALLASGALVALQPAAHGGGVTRHYPATAPATVSGFSAATSPGLPRSTAVPLTQALQQYPALHSLPAGGTVVSNASHTSWWVKFTAPPPFSAMTLLARIGVGWGYSATRSFPAGSESALHPSTMTGAELVCAGLPLPPTAKGTPQYATWLAGVHGLLPRLHYQNTRPTSVVAPGTAWYTSTATSPNWAGSVDTQATYNGIQAQFHMANTAYTLPYGQGIAQWVGLGGDTSVGGNIGLTQAGGDAGTSRVARATATTKAACSSKRCPVPTEAVTNTRRLASRRVTTSGVRSTTSGPSRSTGRRTSRTKPWRLTAVAVTARAGSTLTARVRT